MFDEPDGKPALAHASATFRLACPVMLTLQLLPPMFRDARMSTRSNTRFHLEIPRITGIKKYVMQHSCDEKSLDPLRSFRLAATALTHWATTFGSKQDAASRLQL
jgi:hypothetical protein